MPMDSGEPIPLEMFKGDPIMLMSREEQEQIESSKGGAQVVDIDDGEEAKKE